MKDSRFVFFRFEVNRILVTLNLYVETEAQASFDLFNNESFEILSNSIPPQSPCEYEHQEGTARIQIDTV